MDAAETHLRVLIESELNRDQAKEVADEVLTKLFALQHGEGSFGKRVLRKGASIEVYMMRPDLAQITIPVTVVLQGEELDRALKDLGMR
jgi:hypothetical protein